MSSIGINTLHFFFSFFLCLTKESCFENMPINGTSSRYLMPFSPPTRVFLFRCQSLKRELFQFLLYFHLSSILSSTLTQWDVQGHLIITR